MILGYEQANKYTVRDERGDVVAYIAEETPSIASAIGRQLLHTHRSFVATLLDAAGNVMLRVRRPFYFINSQMNIEDAAGQPLGEIVQRWHLWRRNYDLYLDRRQFAAITGSFLAWEFELKDAQGGTLALIDRNFLGLGKELFTDAGKYVIHFGMPPDVAADQATASRQALVESQAAKKGAQTLPPITQLAQLRTEVDVVATQEGKQLMVARSLKLSERAIALACAITIDFDYFSQHSGGPGMLPFIGLPLPMPMPTPVPSGGEGVPDAAGMPPPPGEAAGDGVHLGGDEWQEPPTEAPSEPGWGDLLDDFMDEL